MNGIILAGGRATRLGPLTAQMNKGLVSVGQRPVIAHQLEAFRRKGIREVVIVVSPDSERQVRDVVKRSQGELHQRVRFVVQSVPLGPGHALWLGAMQCPAGPVTVLMADTFIELDDLPETHSEGSWIGVAPAPATRHWCAWHSTIEAYIDDVFEVGDLVTVGAYGFADVSLIRPRMDDQALVPDGEVGMGKILTRVIRGDQRWREAKLDSWLDIGDVVALAAARRRRFITRSFNHLSLSENGVLTKRGSSLDIRREATFFQDLNAAPDSAQLLFPRLTHVKYDAEATEYGLEYVDMPTLAELYLYWPGRPDMWSEVIRGIIRRLRADLWDPTAGIGHHPGIWAEQMYDTKVTTRLNLWARETGRTDIDWRTVERLLCWLEKHHTPNLVRGHGDLNFNNILYGLGSGTIKLVDPRGDAVVDLAYELAKLRYSYRDHFCTITHGLFEVTSDGVVFGPNRSDDATAMDGVLSEFVDLDVLTAIEATLFLSAVPLHDGDEQLALYHQGIALAKQVLGDDA